LSTVPSTVPGTPLVSSPPWSHTVLVCCASSSWTVRT
jgi:hypothetical protein